MRATTRSHMRAEYNVIKHKTVNEDKELLSPKQKIVKLLRFVYSPADHSNIVICTRDILLNNSTYSKK